MTSADIDEPAKLPALVSQELAFLSQAVTALVALDQETRERVMGYLVDRFGAGYSAAKVAKGYWEDRR
jgi:hypothetical protein